MEKYLERARGYLNSYTIVSRAHYLASDRYATYNRWFGVPNIILSAAAGTTILSQLSANSPDWRLLAGILALFSAVLSSLHSFLGFATKSERHKAAAEAYRNIKRRFDTFLLDFQDAKEERHELAVHDFKAIMEKVEDLAPLFPSLPDGFYDKAERELVKQTPAVKGMKA